MSCGQLIWTFYHNLSSFFFVNMFFVFLFVHHQQGFNVSVHQIVDKPKKKTLSSHTKFTITSICLRPATVTTTTEFRRKIPIRSFQINNDPVSISDTFGGCLNKIVQHFHDHTIYHIFQLVNPIFTFDAVVWFLYCKNWDCSPFDFISGLLCLACPIRFVLQLLKIH